MEFQFPFSGLPEVVAVAGGKLPNEGSPETVDEISTKARKPDFASHM
jgi:hypothetical protein